MSASISISMDISCIDSIATRLSLNRDRAHALLDSAIKKDTDPYVAMRQGTLASSVLRTPSGRGEVVYDTPYARHMYYGVHYRTGKPFHYSALRRPLAWKEGVKASKAVNCEKWKREVKEVLTDG